MVKPETLKQNILTNIDSFESWDTAKQAVPMIDAYTYDKVKKVGMNRIKTLKDLDIIDA